MKKGSRITALALVGVLAATAACSPGGAAAPAGDGSKVTVLYSYETEPSSSAFGTALGQCSQELGTQIDIQTVPSKDLISRVLQLSTTKALPDVLVVDNPDLQSVAESGILTPLAEFGLTGDGFIQGFVDAGTYEGALYGIGPNANTLALFYNTEVFDAAGVEPPATWDELTKVAAKLSTGNRYGIAFSAAASFEAAFQWLPFLWSNGGDETDLDSPEATEALQLWMNLVDSGAASEGVLNWSQADAKEQFAAGKAAMLVGGSWHVPTLREADVPFGVVQIPVGKAGGTSVSALGGELWTIPQTGNQATQASAAKVIDCINSDEKQTQLAEARNTVPTRTALIDSYQPGDPSMAVFSKAVASARSRTGQLGVEWPATATRIYQGVQLGITGKATAADAFAHAG